MIKVIIVSGFLGSGKTTLIKKILKNQQQLKNVMLLENEFGEVGIDGQVLRNDIKVKEINSGCICCSLNGKLEDALDEIATYDIDTLIIEPSGVAKLSEIKKVFKNHPSFELLNSVTMVDVTKAEKYHKNFKDFYVDQIENTDAIILSRTDIVEYKTTKKIMHLCEDINSVAIIVTTPINQLSDDFIFEIINDVAELGDQCECGCGCGCCHDHEHHHEHECDCHHHEHHHEHECGCHEHHHEHECGCHEHHHEHHSSHGVFNSCGFQTPKKFENGEIENILKSLPENILRAKGIVQLEDDSWLHFEYTPDEIFTEKAEAYYSGLISVIGVSVVEKEIKELFKINE